MVWGPVLGLALLAASASLPAAGEFDALITPFIEEHCAKCHGENKQKGDLRLDTLSTDFTRAENAVIWRNVADMLTLGDMPPEEEPRPRADALLRVLKALDTEMRAAAKAQGSGGRIAIRRLSHSALDNTVKDLLGINLKLSENLPADPDLDGFDNLATTLDANPELVLKLQNNARKLARHALVIGSDIRRERHFGIGEIGHGYNVEERNGFVVTSSSRDRKHVMWPEGYVVPQDGAYLVKITAFAGDLRTTLEERGIEYTYLDESYEQSLKNRDRRPQDALRLVAIVAIQASEARHMDAASVPGRRVGFFYVGNEVGSEAVEVRLKKGENVMIHYASGAVLNRSPIARVGGEEMLVADLLHVKEIEVHGPLLESWPSGAQEKLLGKGTDVTSAGIRSRMEDFLFRSFRRPVPKSTVEKFLHLYRTGLEAGLSEVESMRNVVEGVLCSPRFLFNHDAGDGRDAWALASRLSYFLWNSMPDDQLLDLAESGRLLRPNVIRQEVTRMLADKKSNRFVRDFTANWLQLKKIGDMRPDPKLYREYDPLLEGFMREESELFFEQVLQRNMPVTTFLDSDFVFINDRLAKHYRIDGVRGGQFRTVELAADNPRGGLLGQASILKITSNGTRTSPVIRGVWILENILGDPPSPPPADVKPIEPDVRGASTIPEMLAKHREVESCNDCHKKIDAWGMGLEHFDAIGAVRSQYRNGQPIEAWGELPGGSFNGATELKKVLLSRADRFAQALTGKLFTYALGHPLSFAEHIAAEDIAKANLENAEGFKDLIHEICASPLFRGKL